MYYIYFRKFSNKGLLMNSILFSLLCWVFSICSSSIILTASSLESDHSKYNIHLLCFSLSMKSVLSDSLPDSLQFYSTITQLKSILPFWHFTVSSEKLLLLDQNRVWGEMVCMLVCVQEKRRKRTERFLYQIQEFSLNCCHGRICR